MDVLRKQEESVDQIHYYFQVILLYFQMMLIYFQQRFSLSLLFKDFCILLRLRLTFNCFIWKLGIHLACLTTDIFQHNGKKKGKVIGQSSVLYWSDLNRSCLGPISLHMGSASHPLFLKENESVFSTQHRWVALIGIVSIHILINSISAKCNVDILSWCLHWALVWGVFSCISDSVSLRSV